MYRSINRCITGTAATLMMAIVVCMYSCKKEAPAIQTDSGPTLVQVLQNNFQYSLFYHALKITGLDSLLRTSGQYTLFVPDNGGFAQGGIDSEKMLDGMNRDSLKNILLYHIVPGKIFFNDIPATLDNEYKSVSGVTLYVSSFVDPTGASTPILEVNGRYSKKMDVAASNGVIQVLDGTLFNLPTHIVKDYITGNPDYSFFIKALKKFGLFDQLGGPGPVTVFVPNNTVFINNGITEDVLDGLDTVQYKKFLFSCYVLNPDRAFKNDFDQVPQLNSGGYYTSDGILLVNGGSLYVTSNHDQSVFLGGYAVFTNADILMQNGIVHEISDILIYPQNMLK